MTSGSLRSRHPGRVWRLIMGVMCNTSQCEFVTRKFGNVERNSHCDVLHFTPVRVARLFLDCNGVFAIKAYSRYANTCSQRKSAFDALRISYQAGRHNSPRPRWLFCGHSVSFVTCYLRSAAPTREQTLYTLRTDQN